MKKPFSFIFTLCLLILIGTSCSDESLVDSNPQGGTYQNHTAKLINTQGRVDGLTYSLDNIALNSNVIVINKENVELRSSDVDLAQGLVRLLCFSDQLALSLSPGSVLYINYNGYVALLKIESILSSDNNVYAIQTTVVQLGELFQGGAMDLSLDLYKAAESVSEKKLQLRQAYDKNYSNEIANIEGVYKLNSFEYNPSTHIQMNLNMSMTFSKTQLLPSQISTIFEIKNNINPNLTFSASKNVLFQDDLVKFLPQELINGIKNHEFEIKIPINTLGIDSIPAKIKIKDINLPLVVEANLSGDTNFGYNINGSFKMGYVIDISNLTSIVTPVYEKNIAISKVDTENLHGEILSQADIVIVPDISIINDAYKVSGEIKFGVATESNGHIDLPGKSPIFGSKGALTSSMNVIVDLILIKIPIQIFNNETVLWNEGTIDRSITYSNLEWTITTNSKVNILAGTKSFDTDFIINYKYPINGKMIANELLISYDVYQKDGKTKIETVKDAVITPLNATTSNFGFKLSIPFKKEGIFSSKYQKVSYLKNIVIKDRRGYVYEGIYNTSKGIVENSVEIKN